MEPISFGLAFLILTFAGVLTKVLDSSVAGTASYKARQIAIKLGSQIAKTEGMANQLVEAYNRRDYELANNILLASPFSGSYQTLINDRERINKEFKAKKTKLENLSKEMSASKAYADIAMNTSDWIAGANEHENLDKIKHDYKDEIDKLVSGGISEISTNDKPFDTAALEEHNASFDINKNVPKTEQKKQTAMSGNRVNRG